MFISAPYLFTLQHPQAMRKELFFFELRYLVRRPVMYISAALFACFGFFLGRSGGMTFPNIYKNSTYEISYLTGILSIAAVAYITLLSASTMVREKDSRFDVLLFATPFGRSGYLATRFLALFAICCLCFVWVPVGIYTGNQLAALPPDKIGPSHLPNYLRPFLLIALPNIFTCTAILCAVAWITKNRLIVYITGLMIYVLYIVGSIYGNSPLMAGAVPPTPDQLSMAAKLDPFGMAAFFEQTRYWSASQRNYAALQFSGHLLLNRITWCGAALLLLLIAQRYFVYTPTRASRRKPRERKLVTTNTLYVRINTITSGTRYHCQVMASYLRTELLSTVKSISFLLSCALWITLLSIELYSAVNGDPRMGENYPRTGLMVSTILETLPLLVFPLLLFYSSELTWKSSSSKFEQLERTTPVPAFPVLVSRILTLGVLCVCFITTGIVLCVLTQLLLLYPVENPLLYLSVFYYMGWPLMLTAGMLLIIQRYISNRYAGLSVAGLFVVLTNTRIGLMIAITHPLLRFATPFNMSYGDMNGFGAYPHAFHWKILFFSAITIGLLVFTASGRSLKRLLVVGCTTIAIASGGYIFYQVNIVAKTMDGRELNDWKQSYETAFRKFADMHQPAIIQVTARVDLFPTERNYTVHGGYILENRHNHRIDSLLVFIPKESRSKELIVEGADAAGGIDTYGHQWFIFRNGMLPGEKSHMSYRFGSGWNIFRGHTSFNSIVENGSFLRISRYFPRFGYQEDMEISSGIERSNRNMAAQAELAAPDSLSVHPKNDALMNVDLTLSTDGDQTAVSSGTLIRQWKEQGRNLFEYRSDRPMPFRFAVSSARYEVKKDMYKQIPIEIYYDPGHRVNVDKLISDAKQTIAYCEDAFGVYPHAVVRFAEISSFTEGFAATAYPGVVFMRENAGFYNDISHAGAQDVINQLAGHELSHQWWGAAVWSPVYQQGGWILTEMLANYTALMLYKKQHGADATAEILRQHLDTYLSSRSYSKETTLYRTDYNSPHLAYNKGLLAMWQLSELAGEANVNRALAALFRAHADPDDPPTSPDLLKALYTYLPVTVHGNIRELFEEIVLWDAKITRLQSTKRKNGYMLTVDATVTRIREDAADASGRTSPDRMVDLLIVMRDGSQVTRQVISINGKVHEELPFTSEPVKIILDPLYKMIEADRSDNEKQAGEGHQQ